MFEKVCSKCDCSKTLDCFGVQLSRGGTLRAECNSCRSQYYHKNRKYLLDKQKKYNENNKQSIKKYQKSYLSTKNVKRRTEEKYILGRRQYENRKKDVDLNYKLRKNLRSRLIGALYDNCKSDSILQLIGCSIEALKQHLESKFYSNPRTSEMMTWDNYGFRGWHIDHVKALSKFDLSEGTQQRIACNYKNLQPLWWFENLQKNDR
ncbi:MAG: hypothetical protein Q7K54_05125 [Candidatus Parcubacteria bacterium]|nr:hypothetical protein [Candidatus Parcubacteria bacterium]